MRNRDPDAIIELSSEAIAQIARYIEADTAVPRPVALVMAEEALIMAHDQLWRLSDEGDPLRYNSIIAAAAVAVALDYRKLHRGVHPIRHHPHVDDFVLPTILPQGGALMSLDSEDRRLLFLAWGFRLTAAEVGAIFDETTAAMEHALAMAEARYREALRRIG